MADPTRPCCSSSSSPCSPLRALVSFSANASSVATACTSWAGSPVRTWLPSPTRSRRAGSTGGRPLLLAVSAALLWGLGTVLGRHLGAKLPFAELTALRLATGLVAALVALGVTGDGSAYSHLSAKAVLALVLLALVPGLLSLLVYYRGLRATPAAAATLGELAFPFTALFLDYLAFGSTLSPSQWVGLALLVTTITTMGTLRANGTPTGVEVPELDRIAKADPLEPLAITGS